MEDVGTWCGPRCGLRFLRVHTGRRTPAVIRRKNRSGQDVGGISIMTQTTAYRWQAGILAAIVLSGCQSLGTTVRGQSPDLDSKVEQAGHRYHQPVLAARDAVADAYREHHNTDTTYYSPDCQNAGHGSCPPSVYPPGYMGAYGPAGSGLCPSGACPSGVCGHGGCRGGNELNWYPQHHYTYSYQRPNDLVYPPAAGMAGSAGAVGGAVVYPYYTHRGPSDFFRQ